MFPLLYMGKQIHPLFSILCGLGPKVACNLIITNKKTRYYGILRAKLFKYDAEIRYLCNLLSHNESQIGISN